MFFWELLTLFYTCVQSIALPCSALRARQGTKKLANHLQSRTDQGTGQDRTEKVPCEVSDKEYTIQKLLLTNGEILKYFLRRSCNGTYINCVKSWYICFSWITYWKFCEDNIKPSASILTHFRWFKIDFPRFLMISWDFHRFLLISLDSCDFSWFLWFLLISVISLDFCDFSWFLWFLLISVISLDFCDFSWFLWFLLIPVISLDFCDFSWFLWFLLISVISLDFCDFSWFLLISAISLDFCTWNQFLPPWFCCLVS